MKRMKWALLAGLMLAGFAMTFMLEGAGKSDASGSGDMADPYLDPFAMTLAHRHAAVETASEKAVRMRFEWPEGAPAAGEAGLLRLTVTGKGGTPIESFDVVNEKLIHLVVVSRDLAEFQHVHPEYKGKGIYELDVAFPAGGSYKLYADFQPTGMNELTRTAEVAVAGTPGAAYDLTPSESFVATVDGMQVELTFDQAPAKLQALTMTYTFTDAKTGEPIRDLELYLGAVGHAVAIDEGLNDYLHLHPLNWASSGPQAVFGVSFPRSGLYKLWGQFQRNGEVFLVPFTAEVR
ncbi:hypothetical protein ACFSL6_08380 [Paenibacillus thailandensis]|uniref:YtkA-like domain-containing protein n=1 Tax=Paenibacillus thailandensis TaxID=393250 RepID=A0ABW5QUY2_9BACL